MRDPRIPGLDQLRQAAADREARAHALKRTVVPGERIVVPPGRDVEPFEKRRRRTQLDRIAEDRAATARAPLHPKDLAARLAAQERPGETVAETVARVRVRHAVILARLDDREHRAKAEIDQLIAEYDLVAPLANVSQDEIDAEVARRTPPEPAPQPAPEAAPDA